jgi:hypothetical protein
MIMLGGESYAGLMKVVAMASEHECQHEMFVKVNWKVNYLIDIFHIAPS